MLLLLLSKSMSECNRSHVSGPSVRSYLENNNYKKYITTGVEGHFQRQYIGNCIQRKFIACAIDFINIKCKQGGESGNVKDFLKYSAAMCEVKPWCLCTSWRLCLNFHPPAYVHREGLQRL